MSSRRRWTDKVTMEREIKRRRRTKVNICRKTDVTRVDLLGPIREERF